MFFSVGVRSRDGEQFWAELQEVQTQSQHPSSFRKMQFRLSESVMTAALVTVMMTRMMVVMLSATMIRGGQLQTTNDDDDNEGDDVDDYHPWTPTAGALVTMMTTMMVLMMSTTMIHGGQLQVTRCSLAASVGKMLILKRLKREPRSDFHEIFFVILSLVVHTHRIPRRGDTGLATARTLQARCLERTAAEERPHDWGSNARNGGNTRRACSGETNHH